MLRKFRSKGFDKASIYSLGFLIQKLNGGNNEEARVEFIANIWIDEKGDLSKILTSLYSARWVILNFVGVWAFPLQICEKIVIQTKKEAGLHAKSGFRI